MMPEKFCELLYSREREGALQPLPLPRWAIGPVPLTVEGQRRFRLHIPSERPILIAGSNFVKLCGAGPLLAGPEVA